MSESNMQKMQIPYTPTTEEVRNLFSWHNDEGEIVAKGGFDRWLAEVKADAFNEGYVAGKAIGLSDGMKLIQNIRHRREEAE